MTSASDQLVKYPISARLLFERVYISSSNMVIAFQLNDGSKKKIPAIAWG